MWCSLNMNYPLALIRAHGVDTWPTFKGPGEWTSGYNLKRRGLFSSLRRSNLGYKPLPPPPGVGTRRGLSRRSVNYLFTRSACHRDKLSTRPLGQVVGTQWVAQILPCVGRPSSRSWLPYGNASHGGALKCPSTCHTVTLSLNRRGLNT